MTRVSIHDYNDNDDTYYNIVDNEDDGNGRKLIFKINNGMDLNYANLHNALVTLNQANGQPATRPQQLCPNTKTKKHILAECTNKWKYNKISW